jgi:asparagine synthetase B (glutamine-hydrolysing)
VLSVPSDNRSPEPQKATPLEVLSGYPYAPSTSASGPRRAVSSSEQSPVEWLVDFCRQQDRPIAVEFSGGVDSTLVFAAAVRAARESDGPLPLPVTVLCRGIPEADETEWQDAVLRGLGISDRLVLTVDAELDLIEPRAMGLLERYGQVWPATTFPLSLVHEHVRGLRLLTGHGGDEVLGPRRLTPALIVAAKIRHGKVPNRSDLGRVRSDFTLTRTRAKRRLGEQVGLTWIREPWRERVLAHLAARSWREPWNPRSAIRHLCDLTAVRRFEDSITWVASLNDVELQSPLQHPAFLESVSRNVRLRELRGRESVARALFGDLIPPLVLGRRSKAQFNRAFFNDCSREFSRQADMKHLGVDIVDPAELRRVWSSEAPPPMSAMLLQALRMGRSLDANTLDMELTAAGC